MKLKGVLGEYAIGECGIVDLDSYENQECAVDNKNYNAFDKRELYWTIYDQIIIPTRERMGTDSNHTLRLLFIEEDVNKMVLHFNIDDYDEAYCEISDVDTLSLADAVKTVFNDLNQYINNLPDNEPMKKAFTWEKSRAVSISADYIERLKKDVFYSSWEIGSVE